MSHRTPTEILKMYTKRVRRGENISPAQVYRELLPDEWFAFTMATIKLRTPEMEHFMGKVYVHAGNVIDDIFGVCHWKIDRIRCIKTLKMLSQENLKEYNKLKSHICKLSKKRWAGWQV